MNSLSSLGYVCLSPDQQVKDYVSAFGVPSLSLYSFFDIEENTKYLVFTGEAESIEDFENRYYSQITDKNGAATV